MAEAPAISSVSRPHVSPPLPPARPRGPILVGIDEAGYGPVLGPLVISAVAFELPADLMPEAEDGVHAPNLWKVLKKSVEPKPRRKSPLLAVADSKVLHGKGPGKEGVALLERAALTFMSQLGDMPLSLRRMLNGVCPPALQWMIEYPWYAEGDVELPVDCQPADLGTQCNALRRDLERNGIRFLGAWVEILPEGHFNRLVGATHNKATVLFNLTTRLLQRVSDALGGLSLHVWVDRQGGRTSYLRPLMTAFEGARFDVLEESADCSGYRLTHRSAQWLIRFICKGESHHLPIALASIFSKYTRELFMMRFNDWWAQRVDGLKPTAGYYNDGMRFIEDITAAIDHHHIDRAWLIRTA